MKKITEAELSNCVNSLREKLILESNGEVVEAWYDPSSWGKPDYQATTAQKGKKSQRNYALALQQIKDLYNKAEVSYPPKDDIVRQRYGLPPALPAFDQWDGTMPNAGQADYLTRNLFGRGASADAQTQNADNQSAAQKKIATDAAVDAKVEELKKAVTSLLALIGTRDAKTGGAVTTAAQPMEATMRRLRNLIAEADVAVDNRNEMDKASDAAAVPTDKAGLIKQCQLLMSEIEKLEGAEHDPETVEALKNAQAAIDQAAKAPDEEKKSDDFDANQQLLRDREKLAPGTVGSEVHADGITYAVDANGMCTFKIEGGHWVPVTPPIKAESPEFQGGTGEVKPAPAAGKRTCPTTPQEVAKATRALATANGIAISPTGMAIITPGQEIKLADNAKYIVALGDTLWGIASCKFKGTEPPVGNAPAPTAPAPQLTPKAQTPAPAAPAPTKPVPQLTPKGEYIKVGNPTTQESVKYADDQTLARIVSFGRK